MTADPPLPFQPVLGAGIGFPDGRMIGGFQAIHWRCSPPPKAGDPCLLVSVIWDEYMAKGLGVEIEPRSALCEGNAPVLPLTSHTGWLLVADMEQAPLDLSLHLPFTNSPFTLPLTTLAGALPSGQSH